MAKRITISQAAEIKGVTKRTIHNWILRGRLTSARREASPFYPHFYYTLLATEVKGVATPLRGRPKPQQVAA